MRTIKSWHWYVHKSALHIVLDVGFYLRYWFPGIFWRRSQGYWFPGIFFSRRSHSSPLEKNCKTITVWEIFLVPLPTFVFRFSTFKPGRHKAKQNQLAGGDRQS